MKGFFAKIRENTAGMTGREKAEYIGAYYWYHILGLAAALGLVLFLILHFGFREAPPAFTCVLVNQDINFARDQKLGEDFARAAGLSADQVEVDSDFNLSYGNIQLEGVNESSYEKFFFKWRNQELDAVLMPESFYEYCKELGGAFYSLEQWDIQGLPVYEESGAPAAIKAEKTGLAEYLNNETGEALLLAFPDTGKNQEQCGAFLEFLRNSSA